MAEARTGQRRGPPGLDRIVTQLTPDQRAKLELSRRQHRREAQRRRAAAITAEVVGTLIVTFATLAPDALARGLGFPLGYAVQVGCTGIATMVVIYALGDVSGAHTNPVMTVAFALRGDFFWSRVPEYLVAQFAGAVAAAALVLGMLHPPAAAMHPQHALGLGSAFTMEIVLTAILVLVALATAHKARFLGPQTAFANGATTLFDRLVGYNVSGGSMNPARTLGPALVFGWTSDWWVYALAPLLGCVLAVALTWYLVGGPNDQEAQKSHG